MALSISLVSNGLTAPVLSGDVKIEGIDLEPVEAKRVDANTRAMMRGEFDIAEMSLATFVKMREDSVPLIGLPIFTGRRFAEPGMGVRPDVGIEKPEHLKGRRVGLPQFWMTSSVWHRAVLEDFYQVPASEIEWVTVQEERFEDRAPADGSQFDYVEGGSLKDMIAAGDIDAILFPRPIAERFDANIVTCLFPDVAAAQRDFYSRREIYPIMHFVVAQENVLAENPGLAENLERAFRQIRLQYLLDSKRDDNLESPIYGEDFDLARKIFKEDDAWRYGIEANQNVLDWFLDKCQRQGLTKKRMSVDDLFAVGETK